jgi:hypothetical protein
MTLVSWNASAALIRFEAVEFEVRRQPAAILSQTRQQLASGSRPLHFEPPPACDVDLYVIALLELKGFDDAGGKAHGQTVTPFGYLHFDSPWIYKL